MEYQNIIKELNKRRKGSFISLEYKTQPTLSALGKKENIKVEKKVATYGRFGVNYSNIKAVKEQREQDKQNGIVRQQKTQWWNWKDKNIIKQNINDNNKLYLTLTTSKNAKAKIEYFINGKIATKQELMNSGYVISSYFTTKEMPQQIDINIDNIIKIKEKV